jgi:hypothetical protein
VGEKFVRCVSGVLGAVAAGSWGSDLGKRKKEKVTVLEKAEWGELSHHATGASGYGRGESAHGIAITIHEHTPPPPMFKLLVISCAPTANIGLYTTPRLLDAPAQITTSVLNAMAGKTITTRPLFREVHPI